MDFLHVSHLLFCNFCMLLICARCIDHCALSGLPAGGQTDDKARFTRARREVKRENMLANLTFSVGVWGRGVHISWERESS